MDITRQLEDVVRDLAQLERQGLIKGFLASTRNAKSINGLAEDVRGALMDYQVCMSSCLFSTISDNLR